MPTYQYACTACEERLEVVQRFSDEPLTECPACQGRLRKVFSAVGVVFKGSGFYQTDSRAAAGKPAKSGESGGASEGAAAATSDGGSTTKKESSSEAKPAPAAPAAPAASTASTTGGSKVA